MELEGEVFIQDGKLCFGGTDESGFVFGGFPLETVIRTKMKHLGVLEDRPVLIKIDIKKE